MRRPAALVLVLVAALALDAACSKAPSDLAIANDVKAKMFAEPQLKSASVDVMVNHGEVTLTGDVPNDAARYQAFKLASETQGVAKVNDRLSVNVAQAAPPAPEPAPEPAPAPVRKAPKRTAARVREETPPPPLPPPAAPVQTPAAQPPTPPVAPVERQPVRVEIPAGTSFSIRMIDSIDSEVNHASEVFHASLDAPIVIDDKIVVPSGTDVFVKLVEARSAGRLSGRSELRLELVKMEFQGKSYPLASSTYEQVGTSRGKRTAATVGAGAGIGAAIGAIAGGGRGAAIGAGVGAASGTAIQVLTKGKQIRIPSETKLDFRLEQPVEVTYLPEKNKSRR